MLKVWWRKQPIWIHELDQDVYQQAKSDYIDSAENIINRELLNALPKDKVGEFKSILNGDNSNEGSQAFLAKNIENTDEIVLNALLELKATYIKSWIGWVWILNKNYSIKILTLII